MASTLQGTPTNAAGTVVVLDGTGKLPAVDGSQLTGIPAPITTKLVTDSTDIVLNDIASGYNNVGSSFSVNIPTSGVIRALITGRLRADVATVPIIKLGIRIGAANYWFAETSSVLNGAAPQSFRVTIGTVYASVINDYVEAKGSGFSASTAHGQTTYIALSIQAMGLPTGTQTVQLIAAREANACSLRGTTTQTRCVLEFVSAS